MKTITLTSLVQPARYAAIGTLAGLLAGCAAGPDYQRPELTLPQMYTQVTAASPAQEADAAAQRYALQQDIASDWWTIFRSPVLDKLVAQALAANPTIETAQAALRAAQEDVAAQRGSFFPVVEGGYLPARTKISGNLGGNSPGIQGNGSVIATTEGTPASQGGTAPFTAPAIYNFHTAQITVGYSPDIFGANRRAFESLEARQRASRFQLEAAYITLASNVVAAAFQDALLRRQITIIEDTIAADRQALSLARRQHDAGQISGLDLAMRHNAAAQSHQLLPPLKKQFEQNRNLLRILAGVGPTDAVPAFDLAAFHLPDELPLTLPSQLVEQRPDIRMVEEQLRAASAQVGVARAARLPQFAITGSAGGAASQLSQMFWTSGKFFDLTANIALPLFDGGTLKHREHAAEASLRGAVADYRATVATAFQNVADVLQAIEADNATLLAAREAGDAARSLRDLTERQHARGHLDRLALINAEQDARQAELGLAQAQASRLGNAAALFHALGGGWWNREDDNGVALQQQQ